ncbi:MAG TPA: polyprenyl synthetase family protein [Thermomicrobiales bacterium]|nr:polyprenyl synthetase family protein [Thermomicrobiales bacterium]
MTDHGTTSHEKAAHRLQEEAVEHIDRAIDTLLGELDGSAALLRRMASYHFGTVTPAGTPVPIEEQRRIRGKRMRPMIAVLSCVAAGGDMAAAAPLAGAIELLHNFTLIHDDIQDRSPNRRHRSTVWRIWGDAQAINAGDALFAAAQIGVLGSPSQHIGTDGLLVIARAFNRMTIDIVRGQVLDLEFEGQRDVSPDDYLGMIRGKTAAIVQFSAWAGSMLGGASTETARRFAQFGEALGVGFQIRDDALGIWGETAETGKDTADDIRRRKQSLPVLLLREAASDADRQALDQMFGGDRVAEDDVVAVLSMLKSYDIAQDVERRVRAYHEQAVAALDALSATAEPNALAALRALTDRMAVRST